MPTIALAGTGSPRNADGMALGSRRTRSRCDRRQTPDKGVGTARQAGWTTRPRSRPTPRGPAPGAKAPPRAGRNKGRRTSWSTRGPCRRRSGDARATSCASPCGCTGGGSSVRSWQQPRLEPIQRGGNFGLLDRGGGIDVLGAHIRAGADEGALPNALVARHHLGPLLLTSVTRVESVAVRQRERRRPDEALI